MHWPLFLERVRTKKEKGQKGTKEDIYTFFERGMLPCCNSPLMEVLSTNRAEGTTTICCPRCKATFRISTIPGQRDIERLANDA